MATKKSVTKISRKIAIQTLTLATSSLGLVAALAWNEAIKEYVDVYVRPYFARGSAVLSLFLYAIGITLLTVIVTWQLNRLTRLLDKQGK